MRVDAVGVVVPVHDEQELLARCLVSLRTAATGCDVPVHIVIVLDACTDASAALCAAAGELATSTTLVTADLRCVGAARTLGCRAVLDRLGVAGTWLASTDADSRVPADWLRRGVAYAAEGYDAVAGTVQVDDWSSHEPDVCWVYLAGYDGRRGHRHVHGANLAVSAAAYVDVGGFDPVVCHEDTGLVAALIDAGRSVAWAADLAVVTSGRARGRAPGGFSGYLRALAEPAAPEALEALEAWPERQRPDSANASLIRTRPPLRSRAPA